MTADDERRRANAEAALAHARGRSDGPGRGPRPQQGGEMRTELDYLRDRLRPMEAEAARDRHRADVAKAAAQEERARRCGDRERALFWQRVQQGLRRGEDWRTAVDGVLAHWPDRRAFATHRLVEADFEAR